MPDARAPAAAMRSAAVGLAAGAELARRVDSRGRALLEEELASNLIETALVLPLYFLLVFGLMSFAIILFAYGNASYASRLGARFASTHSSTSLLPCTASSIQNLVAPYLWGAPAGTPAATVLWSPSNTIGSTVTITVKMTYTTGMPYTSFKGVVVTAAAQQVIVH